MKKTILLLSAVFLFPLLSQAAKKGLTFYQTEVAHDAGVMEKEFKATFGFTNDSDSAIEVLEVRPTCGCTVAELEKKVYQPGEYGEINTTFNYGSREGRQTKTIVVTTDQEENSKIRLTMRINIPKSFKLTPSVLIWNSEKESIGESKSVILESLSGETVAIETIAFKNEKFDFSYEPIDGGKSYKITVTPKENLEIKGILRDTLEIQTDFVNKAKGRLKIYALVR